MIMFNLTPPGHVWVNDPIRQCWELFQLGYLQPLLWVGWEFMENVVPGIALMCLIEEVRRVENLKRSFTDGLVR